MNIRINSNDSSFTLPEKSTSQLTKMQLSPRMEVFKLLSDDIPQNDYDLPQYIYIPTLITADFFDEQYDDQIEILNQAMIPIQYDEGFPAFPNGMPIWSQMADEPEMIYDAFVQYLRQTEDQSQALRQLALIDSPNFSMYDLQQGYLYYSWSARSRAHDMFHIASHRKLRERRILSTNDRIYLKSEQLFAGLETYFNLPGDEDPNNKRWIEEMTPAVAIKFLETLNKIQRISLGLPAGGGEYIKNTDPEFADTDVLIKSLVAKGRNPSLDTKDESKISLEMLLNNPETAKLAQELLVHAKVQK